MSNFHNIDGYEPLFELGIYKKDSPACGVLVEDQKIDPIILAALVVALFEAAMKNIPENEQISFEKKFNKALRKMMKERFNYEVIHKHNENDDI